MSEDIDTAQEMRALRKEVARLNKLSFVRIHNSIPKLLGYSFARGLAFGLGTVLGASVLLSLVAWSVSQVEFLPVIGEWAAEIADQMEAARE
ncbi:DUF5665 domain-containing protein [Roseovarius phycicola]|uniref:DUF5665 domain-containing protein n=1 Tax=Roseovarius phycicola TaxID=3080976 RepID=A0ABZ2HMI5_9RHOB